MSTPGVGFKDLLQRIREGSEEAASELLVTYGPAIRRVIRRNLHKRLRTRYDSADFEQEVWTAFFANPPDPMKLDQEEALVGFLVRMAIRKVLDTVRGQFQCEKRDLNREKSLNGSAAGAVAELAGAEPSPSARLAAKERWEQLPALERRILELLCEGKPQTQIAAELGVTDKRVRAVFRSYLWGDRS